MQAGHAHFPELGSGGKSDLADIFKTKRLEVWARFHGCRWQRNQSNSPKLAFFVISFRKKSPHKGVERNVGQKKYSAVFDNAMWRSSVDDCMTFVSELPPKMVL